MTCGYASSGGDDPGTVAQCGVPITLPADAAAGTWRVASIVVINNAGRRSAYRNPVSPSVTATRNDPLRASDFALDPALADTWRGPADGRLTMKVAGARKGVARVEVDTEGDCNQAGAATATAGGTVTVPLHYFMQNGDCLVKGIAIVDGAGHAAVYGAQYEAPDPGLVARRLPDTTPPVVTGAGVDMTATAIAVTIHAQILTAPLTDADVVVYNDRGWRVAQVSTGIAQAEDGSVVVHVPLPDLETGIYTVGFRLSDAGLLTSEWGMPDAPDSRPVPGGPVAFTIAAG
jgi:hypothetical protein